MPEIWLGYGSTDIVLDIKFENLANELTPAFKALDETEVKSILETVQLKEGQLILVLSAGKAVARIVYELVKSGRMQGVSNLSIDVPSPVTSILRSNLAGIAEANSQDSISVNRIDPGSYSIAERLERFASAVVISNTSVDPLFGFGGVPTSLLRYFMASDMAAAFSSRRDNIPAPGVSEKPLEVAVDAMAKVNILQSVEVIAGGRRPDEISGLHAGPVAEAFYKSVSQLKANCEYHQPKSKAVIASAGEAADSHSTLNNSLNSLWNTIPYVDDGGTAVLLAECRNGIGGGALQMCIEGKIKPEQFDTTLAPIPYTSGIEHLMYIKELGKKFDLGIVTSLPKYYAGSQLGFSVYRGAKEALENTLQKRGKNSKILVVPDGDLLMPALAIESKS